MVLIKRYAFDGAFFYSTWVCSARSGSLRDSGIDLLKVGIPKLSADSRIDRIGCSILELTVREVRMVLIVGILRILYIPLHPMK